MLCVWGYGLHLRWGGYKPFGGKKFFILFFWGQKLPQILGSCFPHKGAFVSRAAKKGRGKIYTPRKRYRINSYLQK